MAIVIITYSVIIYIIIFNIICIYNLVWIIFKYRWFLIIICINISIFNDIVTFSFLIIFRIRITYS